MTGYLTSDLLNKNNKIKHRFYNNMYGVSRDDKNLKQQKLDAVAKNLEIEPKKLITLSQIHSADFVIIKSPIEGAIPQADALITQTPGLFLGVLTADCVPILLVSKNTPMVAAVHAGWRGAVAGIIENTVSAMLSLGAQDLVAALGPCIWQESYEVSDDFYDHIAQESFFIKNKNSGRYYFDLPAYVTAKLHKAGVNCVESSMVNTYSNYNFNSYRRTTHHPEQGLKSNLSVIGIIEGDLPEIIPS